ncbi:MAG TPA: hypothetical protein VFC16_20525 [Nakamurella sp.]|nr:hypothetical protein [Nakamurella sp.]
MLIRADGAGGTHGLRDLADRAATAILRRVCPELNDTAVAKLDRVQLAYPESDRSRLPLFRHRFTTRTVYPYALRHTRGRKVRPRGGCQAGHGIAGQLVENGCVQSVLGNWKGVSGSDGEQFSAANGGISLGQLGRAIESSPLRS